jgi:hypothetical protein
LPHEKAESLVNTVETTVEGIKSKLSGSAPAAGAAAQQSAQKLQGAVREQTGNGGIAQKLDEALGRYFNSLERPHFSF